MEDNELLSQLVKETAQEIGEWCGLEDFEIGGIEDRLWAFLKQAEFTTL